MPLVYAMVARGTDGTVLAQYAAVNGNMEAVATECWKSHNKSGGEEKFTVTCDGYTFNYVVQGGYVVVVAADEASGRQVPFVCAKRISDIWKEKFSEVARKSPPAVLHRSFSPVLRRELEYCQSHPEEMSRMAAVQSKVDEVKGIMVANVESVLQRGEKVATIQSKSDQLSAQAQVFKQKGAELRTRMWYNSCKFRACLILFTVIVLAAITWMAICFAGDAKCFGGNKIIVPGSDPSQIIKNGPKPYGESDPVP